MNYTIIFGTIVIFVLISILININKIQSDIERINKNLNEISKQVGVPDTITGELKELILQGKNIEAIKKYRIATGASLLEAKQYVDSLTE